jgi:hypothetical protein
MKMDDMDVDPQVIDSRQSPSENKPSKKKHTIFKEVNQPMFHGEI